MFEQDEHVQQMISEVYALTVDLKEGDILTHEAIRTVLGCDPHAGSWDHVVNRVRRRLERERGIATWYEVRVGYKLLTAVEQLRDLPRWRVRKEYRQARMRLRSVEALPDQRLSLNLRKAKALQIHLARETLRAKRRELKEQSTLLSLRPLTPRRPAMES